MCLQAVVSDHGSPRGTCRGIAKLLRHLALGRLRPYIPAVVAVVIVVVVGCDGYSDGYGSICFDGRPTGNS